MGWFNHQPASHVHFYVTCLLPFQFSQGFKKKPMFFDPIPRPVSRKQSSPKPSVFSFLGTPLGWPCFGVLAGGALQHVKATHICRGGGGDQDEAWGQWILVILDGFLVLWVVSTIVWVLDVVIINNDRFFHPTNLTWIPKNKAVENISFVSFDIWQSMLDFNGEISVLLSNCPLRLICILCQLHHHLHRHQHLPGSLGSSRQHVSYATVKRLTVLLRHILPDVKVVK